MAGSDYAILVGISRYADKSLGKLDGPLGDVALIEKWLLKSEGGGVPTANITKILTDEAAPPPVNGEMPPAVRDFIDAFKHLTFKPDGTGFIRRPGSRLYLYFSGHGFSEKYQMGAHAALYTATANEWDAPNIYGTYYAHWTKSHGLFDEIVLIMDCCRDAELAKIPAIPTWRKSTDVGVSQKVKLFEVYGAPRGGKAQERPIPSRNNEVHGLLTHALLMALQHSGPDKPKVSAGAIKSFVEEQWANVCGAEPADAPEILPPSNGEIQFSRAGEIEMPQQFTLSVLAPGSTFEIIDDKLATVATVTIGAASAAIQWTRKAATSAPIQNGAFTIPLPATFYGIVAPTNSGVFKKRFQVGEANVTV